jgi:hypothetical protein
VKLVSPLLQVRNNFFGARGMAGAFTVHTIKNVGHGMC